MGETLYRKSWEPLSEADRLSPKLIKYCGEPENSAEIGSFTTAFGGEHWVFGKAGRDYVYAEDDDYEFLCLTPVET